MLWYYSGHFNWVQIEKISGWPNLIFMMVLYDTVCRRMIITSCQLIFRN
jgi:hypothetical protein